MYKEKTARAERTRKNKKDKKKMLVKNKLRAPRERIYNECCIFSKQTCQKQRARVHLQKHFICRSQTREKRTDRCIRDFYDIFTDGMKYDVPFLAFFLGKKFKTICLLMRPIVLVRHHTYHANSSGNP